MALVLVIYNTCPAVGVGNMTPFPVNTILTTLIVFPIAVAVPCVVPAAAITVPTELNRYDDVERFAIVNVPVLALNDNFVVVAFAVWSLPAARTITGYNTLPVSFVALMVVDGPAAPDVPEYPDLPLVPE